MAETWWQLVAGARAMTASDSDVYGSAKTRGSRCEAANAALNVAWQGKRGESFAAYMARTGTTRDDRYYHGLTRPPRPLPGESMMAFNLRRDAYHDALHAKPWRDRRPDGDAAVAA